MYTPRRSAYVVVQRDTDFAAVRGPFTYFLPGGGCEAEETFERAIEREVREEIGMAIVGAKPLGRAYQYFYAASDDLHFKMEAMFYAANLSHRISSSCEHKLEWLPITKAASLLFHTSHVWAVHQAIEDNVQPVQHFTKAGS
ncbi:MAG: NUDIX domain-containing protein [Burkholderiaceae bacterium]